MQKRGTLTIFASEVLGYRTSNRASPRREA